MLYRRGGLHHRRLVVERHEGMSAGGSYARAVLFSDGHLGVILRHVVPIEQYAFRIAEAHELGYGPGENIEFWSLGLQRKARDVWKETLPPLFLSQVVESYGRCAALMNNVSSDDAVARDWWNVAKYLEAVAVAIGEDPDCAAGRNSSDALDVGGLPEVIHYERLAELMHPDAVESLRGAAAGVAQSCRFGLQAAPSEIQLACLQGLANGEKHAELARRLGYSERHFQRVLADLWNQFGVENTIEGVAYAAAQGWVTVPRDIE